MLLSMRIKKLREEKGLTQKELAEKISVTKSTICYYETGRIAPSINTLNLLAEVLGVSVDYLTGNDYYEIADDDEGGRSLSYEEMEVINEFRRYPRLHKELVEDPKRFVERVKMKLG